MERERLLRIGSFARRTRLSPKALRLYDAEGLLEPAWVDPDTGYRYYAPRQIDEARLIARLRGLEMPLDRIAEVLALDAPLAARAVARWADEVDTAARAKRRLARYLQAHLQGKEPPMYDVAIRSLPAAKVVTVQGNARADELPAFIGSTMRRLLAHLDEAGLVPSGAPFVVYHGQVDTDSDGPVETCVPFDGSLEPAGDIRIRVEPEHDEAYVRLSKAQVAFHWR